MPLTYDYSEQILIAPRQPVEEMQRVRPGMPLKFSPDVTSFLAGLVIGFVALPILLPILGYQVQKRWGPPAK